MNYYDNYIGGAAFGGTKRAKPPHRPEPVVYRWRDGYGIARTAKEMTSEHLWNVLGYIRDQLRATGRCTPSRMRKEAPFYREAVKELHRRGWL